MVQYGIVLTQIATDMSQKRHNNVTIRQCDVRIRHFDDRIGHCWVNIENYNIAIRHSYNKVGYCDGQIR